MPQHFLLTAAARSLSLGQVLRLSDEEAHAKFVAIRFLENSGAPFCPRCGCVDVYTIPTRRTWQCKACKKQFSVTSGTIFASRKLPIRDYLAAIAIFCRALRQLRRDLPKIAAARRAMQAQPKGRPDA
jgi:transposase-like protein